MGEHVGVNHFVIRAATIQKPGAIAFFVRQLSGITSTIKSFCASKGNEYTRFNYLGEWHSHPLFSVEPSNTDHASMKSIAGDPTVGANFVVLVIMRLNKMTLEGSAHTYLPDGTVIPSIFELERMK